MKVISESYLRDLFREGVPETFRLEAGQIMTPSASQLLGEKGVRVLRGKEEEKTSPTAAAPESEAPVQATASKLKYVSAADGGLYETKPEHMTLVSGNRLVPKDHPSIAFRGRIDSCQAEICILQAKAAEAGKTGLAEDLQEIMAWTGDIMRRDVEGTPIPQKPVMGLTEGELRDRSHNPQKYFGTDHLVPSWEMGMTALELNLVRAKVREMEVCAVTALKETFTLEKPDIVQALNRMSHALYVMMLKEKGGMY